MVFGDLTREPNVRCPIGSPPVGLGGRTSGRGDLARIHGFLVTAQLVH